MAASNNGTVNDAFEPTLRLHAREWVRVKDADEIFATLDSRGCLDGLPFMPEMLRYCGQRHRVYKTAHKACDTIAKACSRSYPDMVFLEGIRCAGEEHGGCQAECLVFWKEAWLDRVEPGFRHRLSKKIRSTFSAVRSRPKRSDCDETRLRDAVYQAGTGSDSDPVRYACQATDLPNAGEPIEGYKLSQYYVDLTRGNVTLGEALKVLLFWLFTKTSRLGGYRLQMWLFNKVQAMRGSVHYPFGRGKLEGQTPTAETGLQPGDTVRIKPHAEILATLNKRSKNRGLWFDAEQVPYCGKTATVKSRVNRIVNEVNGEMMEMQNPCIVLDGVFCQSKFSNRRYLCPRAIYSYWREIWLEKIEPLDKSTDTERQ